MPPSVVDGHVASPVLEPPRSLLVRHQRLGPAAPHAALPTHARTRVPGPPGPDTRHTRHHHAHASHTHTHKAWGHAPQPEAKVCEQRQVSAVCRRGHVDGSWHPHSTAGTASSADPQPHMDAAAAAFESRARLVLGTAPKVKPLSRGEPPAACCATLSKPTGAPDPMCDPAIAHKAGAWSPPAAHLWLRCVCVVPGAGTRQQWLPRIRDGDRFRLSVEISKFGKVPNLVDVSLELSGAICESQERP